MSLIFKKSKNNLGKYSLVNPTSIHGKVVEQILQEVISLEGQEGEWENCRHGSGRGDFKPAQPSSFCWWNDWLGGWQRQTFPSSNGKFCLYVRGMYFAVKVINTEAGCPERCTATVLGYIHKPTRGSPEQSSLVWEGWTQPNFQQSHLRSVYSFPTSTWQWPTADTSGKNTRSKALCVTSLVQHSQFLTTCNSGISCARSDG